jgi:DNA-binding MarR family transcriptional regulator
MPAISNDRFQVDPNACLYALSGRVMYRLGELYDEALSPTGLVTRSFLLLNTISDLAPCTIEEVARVTNLDPSSASEALDELVESNLIAFARRSIGFAGRQITLTSAGRLALYEAYPRWSRLHTALVRTLGDDVRRLVDIEAQLLQRSTV